jgi:hypothetical protein
MNSQLEQFLIAGRVKDNLRAAATARQARELRRRSQASTKRPPRQWFAHRRPASTS